MTYLQALRRFNENTRRIVISYVFVLFANFGIYGVVFNLYLLRLGYGSEFVGIVNSIRLLNMALLALPAGWIGRRIGTRTAMLVGLLVSLVGLVAIPASELLTGGLQAVWVAAAYTGSSGSETPSTSSTRRPS